MKLFARRAEPTISPAVSASEEKGIARRVAPKLRMLAMRSFSALDVSSRRAESDLNAQLARGDLSRLRRESRHAEQNSAVLARYFGLLDTNVLGPKGIRFESLLPEEEDRKLVTGAWLHWGERASLDGGLTWTEFVSLTLRSLARDGEAFVRLHTAGPDGPALELLDAELFEDTFEDKRRGIRQSIQVDAFGRPVAYFAKLANGSRLAIPAAEILHLFEQTRPGQLRGVPWAAPVLDSLALLRAYRRAELKASLTTSRQLGFVTQDDDDAQGLEAEDTEKVEDVSGQYDDDRVVLLELAKGKSFTPMPASHPSSSFGPFVSSVRDEIAAGLGVAGFSLSASYADINFSAGRIGLELERDQYRARQRWLVKRLHRPVFLWWLGAASLHPGFPIPPQRLGEFRSHHWVPRGFQAVRPQEEAATNAVELKQGTTSITRILAERGVSLESIVEERRRESDAFKAAGLPDPHATGSSK